MIYNLNELYEEVQKNYETVKESWISKNNPQLLEGVSNNYHVFEVMAKNTNKLSLMQRQSLVEDMNKTNDYLKDIRKRSNI